MKYVGPWTVHMCTVHSWIGHIMRLPKKKKKKKTENADAGKLSAQTGTLFPFFFNPDGDYLNIKSAFGSAF